jgi:hypothetical protein
VIRRVLSDLGPRRRLPTKRAALRAAYPFAQRRGRAYRVWCDECLVQLGLRPTRRRYRDRPPDSPGQRHLFATDD